jgi:hypothetical protein
MLLIRMLYGLVTFETPRRIESCDFFPHNAGELQRLRSPSDAVNVEEPHFIKQFVRRRHIATVEI